MKYRIKIETYGSGRQTFQPQVRRGKFFPRWKAIGDGGVEYHYVVVRFKTRRYALRVIDEHHDGHSEIRSIEFEYITK